jgi:creatinine amidohydrolase
MPSVQIGCSLEHAGFPGTISLTTRTFSSLIEEISEDLFNSGFRELLMINGHGGNKAILDTTVTTLKHAHPDFHPYSFSVLDIAKEKFEEIRKSEKKMIGHADELETSMMLALRPDLVEMSKALREKPAFPEPFSLESEDLAKVTFGWKAKDVTKSGIIGSPDLATSEMGKILLDYVIQSISGIVARM